jgi:hypothetical protein
MIVPMTGANSKTICTLHLDLWGLWTQNGKNPSKRGFAAWVSASPFSWGLSINAWSFERFLGAGSANFRRVADHQKAFRRSVLFPEAAPDPRGASDDPSRKFAQAEGHPRAAMSIKFGTITSQRTFPQ